MDGYDDAELRVGLPLPRSVENLLHKICSEKNQSPPKADVRRKLVVAGEKEALQVLQIVDRDQVGNLSAYIVDLLGNSSSPSPSPSTSSSPFLSPSPSLSSSRSSPPRKRVSVSYSPTRRIYFSSTSASECSGSIPCSLSSRTETPQKPRETGQREVLEALGELEFRRQFLILNYSAGKEFRTVITDEEIRSFKNVSMVEFEKQMWKRFGRNALEPQDRLMHHDWDSRRTHLYYCHVSPEGSYRFKGPYLNSTRTHLQKVLGDDNVLMVKFAEESTSRDPNYPGFRNICKEGILVGLRLYCYFVFKDGGKEEKKKSPTSSPVKCFFIRTHSTAHIDQNASYILSNGCYKTMFDRRLLFMHAHTVPNVAKFDARFSLVLSKTHSMDIDLSQNEFGEIVKRDGEALIHTDGTGYISEDLALLCPQNVHKGQYNNNKFSEIIQNHDEHDDKVEDGAKIERQGTGTREPPMLIQFRMFYNGYAVKGTFLVNKKLQGKTIQIRNSMVKVKPDPAILDIKTVNSLEVVGTSNPPNRTYTSRNLIYLLSFGGVPHKYFEELLDNALREAYAASSSKRIALKVGINYGNMDNDFTIARMILAGIPLEEPYLQYRLSILMKEEKKSLKGGKLYIPECCYLMGTADPTGKLESDEVCVVLGNGQISGKVLVYRNPGIHFGDIHLLKATYIEELESFVGNAKYAIFFSIKGARSVADEIAGGDFDGDMYWVSRNPELLKYFKPSKPWVPMPSAKKVVSKPIPSVPEELEDESINHFLQARFKPSKAMSEAADSWSALMDRYLTLGNDCVEEKKFVEKNLNKLANIYYDALDAAKNGTKVIVPGELKPKLFPHHMERPKSFESKSILGLIYDRVNSYKEEDYSKTEVWKLPCFGDDIIPEDSLKKWKEYHTNYKKEMCDALKNKDNELKTNAADEVLRKYKKLLYEAEDLEESPRSMEEIYSEAIAIYHVTYDHAMGNGSVKNCSFAWNVAGSALFKFYAIKKIGEKAFFCVPSVLKEVL
ncbi:probable RNA-dependent RNA polymerase 5 isoform X4 [Cannabis sativa]|uniref:probable RNA-dependent RNA polymerase 5 isoform X4 n=1 Tax=Cannabis sativa TaxID=3483 RepID=UPI0029C9FB4C|nr:probable RNA-dependent RNA polymerase 5 isoform X4 [Cannabis sativa]